MVTASNGPDAIDLCREQRFDLVLLDENMPGLSGLETLMQLKDIAPNLPVVMVTKNEEEDIMDQAIGSKIADYLIKPVNPKQILLTLKKEYTPARDCAGGDTNRLSPGLRAHRHATERTAYPDEWKELYRRLVHWELELASTGSAMDDLLRMQKEEANATFAKFIKRHYEHWVQHPDERPLMSPDLFKRCIFPRLTAGRKVFLLVLDNLRYDQWRAISGELADDFDIDEDLYYTILPTATQYARNAIFAGLMPLQIKQMYPDLWVDEEEDEGKNLNEKALIAHQLERFRRREQFTYHKLNDSQAVSQLLTQIKQFAATPLNVLVINFIDILSHARTESRMVRELAGSEGAYRGITQSWFKHTPIRQLFRQLAELDYDLIITTDHGSIKVDQPSKVVGDRNVNTNLRYKLGRNLSYNAKDVYEVREPKALLLPQPNLSTAYIFATGNRFFLPQQLQPLRAVLHRHLPAWRHIHGGDAGAAHHAEAKTKIINVLTG